MDADQLTSLGWYVCERQQIWQRKTLKMARPWTSDHILDTHHFTNVYRELDRGTMYAHDVIKNMTRQNAIWFSVAYRMINRVQTMIEFGDNPPTHDSINKWLMYLDKRYETGLPVATRRYLTPSRALYTRATNIAFNLNVSEVMPLAFKDLTSLPGVGRFLGWQILCDLVECEFVEYDPDFVVMGDGACFGVSVLTGLRHFSSYHHDGSNHKENKSRVRGSTSTNEKFASWARYLAATQDLWLPNTFVRWNELPLRLKDIEHSLCEWTRYGVLKEKIN